MKIIVGNWKMNGDKELVETFIDAFDSINTNNTIIICPPTELIAYFKSFKYKIGAQNCCYEDRGAFTGETSPASLKKIGCSYVIIGHSERRQLFGESNEILLAKWKSALKNNLTPIFCVGEKDQTNWSDKLTQQLCVFAGQDLSKTIIAYEPIWSIGTGKVPTNEQISQSLRFIKKMVGDTAILYGGSVNASNCKTILDQNIVDGVLIGSASLKVNEFTEIAKFGE